MQVHLSQRTIFMLPADVFKKDQNGFVVLADKVEAFIPAAYFDNPPLAVNTGRACNTIGYFMIKAYKGKQVTSFFIKVPARVDVLFDEISQSVSADEETVDEEIETPSKVDNDIDEDDTDELNYTRLTTFKGNTFIKNAIIVCSPANVSGFFDVVMMGKLKGIPYEDLALTFLRAAKINKARVGANPMILRAIISELVRNPANGQQFRLTMKSKTDTNFKMVKLKDLPKLNSVFGGLAFEDINTSVQSGVVKTLSAEKQTISPLEAVIYY